MRKLQNLIFLFLIVISFACKQEAKSTINFYKSHEKSRQNLPFSDAVQVDNVFFLTGQIGKNHKTGKLVTGGIAAETKQALENIKAVLKQHT